MKTFIFSVITILTFTVQAFCAEPTSQGSVSGSGTSKAEALANAMGRVPGGAVISSVGYNGYSFPTSDKQQYSKYTCIIRWKRY